MLLKDESSQSANVVDVVSNLSRIYYFLLIANLCFGFISVHNFSIYFGFLFSTGVYSV